jgi:hypothetical protein
MELIDVVATAHFENPQTGAVARKQRLRIGKQLAQYLDSLGLITFVNPIVAAVREYPKTEAVSLGGDEPSTLSQPEAVSQSETVPIFRRGRRRKTDASSQ